MNLCFFQTHCPASGRAGGCMIAPGLGQSSWPGPSSPSAQSTCGRKGSATDELHLPKPRFYRKHLPPSEETRIPNTCPVPGWVASSLSAPRAVWLGFGAALGHSWVHPALVEDPGCAGGTDCSPFPPSRSIRQLPVPLELAGEGEELLVHRGAERAVEPLVWFCLLLVLQC